MMLKKIVPILLAVYIFPFNSIYAAVPVASQKQK